MSTKTTTLFDDLEELFYGEGSRLAYKQQYERIKRVILRIEASKELVARCGEILEWKETGILKGEALRNLAATLQPEEYALRIAETKTCEEAMQFVIATSHEPR